MFSHGATGKPVGGDGRDLTYAGAVDAVVDATELLHHVCHAAFDGLLGRDVQADGQSPEVGGGCDGLALRSHFLGALEVDVGYEDAPRTRPRQGLAAGTSDPAAFPGVLAGMEIGRADGDSRRQLALTSPSHKGEPGNIHV